MKAVCLVVLLFGVAIAKPYESVNDESEDIVSDFIDKIVDDHANPTYAPIDWASTAGPTAGPSAGPTGGPTAGPTGGPTGKPVEKFWAKLAHFLFVNSVKGVKPDEHPDKKYIKPLSELLDEVIGAIKPIMAISKLMHEDAKEMGEKVHKAVQENNLPLAQHVAGEYFIAIQRRFAALVVEASNRGLFKEIDESKKQVENLKRAIKRSVDDNKEMYRKFILKNFNEFRVSDGLRDEPFVKMSLKTIRAVGMAAMQVTKAFKVETGYYTGVLSKLVYLSVDKKAHEFAVQYAGASLLSTIRRSTKVEIALERIYGPKKCYGPKKGKKDDDDDDN